jgi:signal transduction histidine kinase
MHPSVIPELLKMAIANLKEPTADGDQKLHFEVDSELLFQLGEELVARRSVALGELIKNAYDADATEVTVEFRDVSRRGGEIVVTDNGEGMTFETIQNSWMRIATTAKRDEPLSKRFHRPRAGSKGIGRFAARRLAEELELVSIANAVSDSSSAKEQVVVNFRWDAFKPGTRVQDVLIPYQRNLVTDERTASVTLKLRGVRDAWTAEDFSALSGDLFKLISPEARVSSAGHGKRDPGFDVKLVAPEFPEYAGLLTERFLKSAVAVLNGSLTKSGRPTYRATFKRGSRKKKYRLEGKPRKFSGVGPARFELHFFVYRSDKLAGMNINVREAQELGREHGGVHIYYDQFRIPPYGDPGDDWLKVDEDRARRITDAPAEFKSLRTKSDRPMLLLPGNNQLFGRIYLSRFKNPDLKQTANREGFIENTAFESLRNFVRYGIDWMTILYARESAEQRRAERSQRDDPLKLIQKIEHQVEDAADKIGAERRGQIMQSLALARMALEQTQEEQIAELSMLRVLASTGTMISVFNHEIQGILNGLQMSCDDFRKYLDRLRKEDRLHFESNLSRLERWIEQARHQAQLMNLLLEKKARLRRRRLALRELLRQVRDGFAQYMLDEGVEFDDDGVPAGLRTPPMYQCEVAAIVINLITNALKALKYESGERKISVEAERTKGSVVMRFLDNGTGAPREKWDEYFRPFVSESEPDIRLGAGTGLGLKIVRDFVEIYRGTAMFVEPRPPWKTCVEVSIPDE